MSYSPIIIPGGLDCDHIFRTLWQGAAPETGDRVRAEGFDCLVLCAIEYQPGPENFPGVEVLYVPYEDNQHREIPTEILKRVHAAAREVANRLREYKKVLVTCQAGLNRSGLVSALAIHYLTGVNGRICAERVKKSRDMALFNQRFYSYACTINSSRTDLKPLHELEFD